MIVATICLLLVTTATTVNAQSNNLPQSCYMNYASGPAGHWHLGLWGQDVINLGKEFPPTEVYFCLAQLQNYINPNPIAQGPSTGDGVLGLLPTCGNSKPGPNACPGRGTDVISKLIQGGAISDYCFGMCFRPTGGTLYLGCNTQTFPESTQWFPIRPIYALLDPEQQKCGCEDRSVCT